MSTGADAKTMPVTAVYAEGHERLFGNKGPQRGFWVMRCEKCDGVTLAAGETRYDCGGCGGRDCRGSINLDEAPPLPVEAKNAPIMVDRFYEGVRATDGTDIGSRKKRREYMRERGLADADDFKGQWAKQGERREKIKQGKLPSKTRREVIARALYQIDKP